MDNSMKKYLIVMIASLLMLSACSNNTTVTANKEVPAAAVTAAAAGTTEAGTAAAITETETETETEATEEPEPEKPMKEVKIGEMTLKLDPSLWETVDEYITRTEKDGEIMTEEDKADMLSYGENLYVLRDTDAVLWLEASDFEREDGFGTDEDYELYAMSLNTSASQNDLTGFRSDLSERNGIRFLDSFMTMDTGNYTRLCTIMKDQYGYSLMLSNYSSKNEKEYLYSLIDTITFDEN